MDCCCVCQADAADTLACGHALCDACLTGWALRNVTCPLCRAPFAWSFRAWYDGERAGQLRPGQRLRLWRCGEPPTDATVESLDETPYHHVVLSWSNGCTVSTPTDVLVRLDRDAYGDMSVTSSAYVAGLVQACAYR